MALPLLALAITSSASQAGLISTLMGVVGAIAAVPGGVLVDAIDRRRVMQGYAGIGVLVWAVGSLLVYLDVLEFWSLLVLALVASLNGGLFGHGTNAALRSIVRGEAYAKAQAANQGRDGVVRLTAGPVGGVLYGVTAWMPFAASTLGYLVLGIASLGLRTDLRPRTAPEGVQPRGTRGLRPVVAWMVGKPVLLHALAILSLRGFALFGAMFLFIAALRETGASPAQISWLPLGLGVGGIAGALLAGFLVSRVRTGQAMVISCATIGLALLPALWWLHPLAAAGMLAAASCMAPLSNASGMGYLMSIAPVAMQGRILALVGLATSGIGALAPVTVGLVLDTLGYRAALLTLVGAAGAAMLLALMSSPLRRVGRPADWESERAS